MTTPAVNTMRKINAIKDGLVAKLVEQKAALGLKSIKADISPQDMVEAMKQESRDWPAAIVLYGGCNALREGMSLILLPRFSILLAHVNKVGPYVSGREVIDVIDDLMNTIDGQRLADEQAEPFAFTGCELRHQDAKFVMYELEFATRAVLARRF